MRAAKRRSFALLLAAALLGSLLGYDHAPAVAGDQTDPTQLVVSDIPDRDDGPTHPRLDRPLAALEDRVRRGPPLDRQIAAAETVDVTIQVSSSRGASVQARLRSLGAEGVSRHGDFVFATVKGGQLTSLAATDGVEWVQTASEPVPLAVVTGQGVAAIDADDWHAAGITGEGVKVAVIDLGFVGWTDLVNGELPPLESITLIDRCDTPLGANKGPITRVHGTAVAEIVHEVAPNAELVLICIDNSADLSDAVNDAKAHGVRVINHSVGWFNTGRGDGTGEIGGIVGTAHGAGILWVNSAGNSAQRHWGGTFSDPDSNNVHNFAVGDEGISFELANGDEIAVFLRWDDWTNRTIDYNLELYSGPGNDATLVALPSCTEPPTTWCNTRRTQSGSAPPTEELYYKNTTGSSGTFHIAIHKIAGQDLPVMDLFVSGLGQIQHADATRSITDPATAPFVVAVGAYCWQTGAIRAYSSQGPTISGLPKPDLSGPDGVSNATYGNPSNCSGGFTGTSASSPHVAGATALLLSACPLLTYGDLKPRVVGMTMSAGSGTQNTFGAGRLKLGDPAATTSQAWCAAQSDPIDHPFTDIVGHEYEDAMAWLWDRNITVGCAPTRYCPDRLLTREEMATFVRRITGLSPTDDNGPFVDHLTSEHRRNINSIRIAGITVGCSATAYCPTRTLTRAEIATLIRRSATPNMPGGGDPPFTDISTHWGLPAITATANANVAWACSGTLFCPDKHVDRAEMAQWIYRAWQEGYLPKVP